MSENFKKSGLKNPRKNNNPILWLLAYIVVIVLACLLNYMLPFLIALAFCVPPLTLFARDKNTPFFKNLPNVLRAMVVFPPMIAAILAPVRAIFVIGHSYFEKIPANIPIEKLPVNATTDFLIGIYHGFDVFVGACGAIFGIAGGLVSFFILYRQARQVENLPTSQAASAAIGLAEFRGKARPVDDSYLAAEKVEAENAGAVDWGVPGNWILLEASKYTGKNETSASESYWSRFYLEDDSGRILVDPIGAKFWNGVSSFGFEPVKKIYLKNSFSRTVDEDGGTVSTQFLLPGDDVYLIGSVEMNEKAPLNAVDSERLIVRPATRKSSRNPVLAWILGEEKFGPGKDIWDTFFLSDTDEMEASEILFKSAKQAIVIGMFWAGLSIWLLTLALR